MKKIITNNIKILLPTFSLLTAIVLIFRNEYQQANYFVVFYGIWILEDCLKEIKNSINRLWYSIYLKNKEE